jgi:hypothetical protein
VAVRSVRPSTTCTPTGYSPFVRPVTFLSQFPGGALCKRFLVPPPPLPSQNHYYVLLPGPDGASASTMSSPSLTLLPPASDGPIPDNLEALSRPPRRPVAPVLGSGCAGAGAGSGFGASGRRNGFGSGLQRSTSPSMNPRLLPHLEPPGWLQVPCSSSSSLVEKGTQSRRCYSPPRWANFWSAEWTSEFNHGLDSSSCHSAYQDLDDAGIPRS